MSGLEFEPRGAVLSEMGIGIPIPLPFDVDLDERKLQMHSGGGGAYDSYQRLLPITD